MHKPTTAFKEMQDQLQKLEVRIMRLIAATLDRDLNPYHLEEGTVKRTLKVCEDKFLPSAKGSPLPLSPRNAYSPAPDALSLNRLRREGVLSSPGVSKFKGHERASLVIFYDILDRTKVLSDLLSSLDGMVTLTAWALFVTKAIDVQPLIALLEDHWLYCTGPLKVGGNHYLKGTKSWVALQSHSALGSLPPLKNELNVYTGLATLGQGEARELLLTMLENDIYTIKALCSDLKVKGLPCEGLLQMEVLSVLGSVVALSPAALPASGGWDEKEEEQFVRVNSSRPVRPVLPSNALMNTELEIKKIAQDSGLEEKESPPVLGNTVSVSQPEESAPMVASSRNVADEEKKLASDFGYHPERYKDLQLKQLSGELVVQGYGSTFSNLFGALQWVDWHLNETGAVADVSRRYYWGFWVATDEELSVVGNHYRELLWWLVVLTGADVTTLSIAEVGAAQTAARHGGQFPTLTNMVDRLQQMRQEAPARLSKFYLYQEMEALIAHYRYTLLYGGSSDMSVELQLQTASAFNRTLERRNRLLEEQLAKAKQKTAKAKQEAAEAKQEAAEAKQEAAEADQRADAATQEAAEAKQETAEAKQETAEAKQETAEANQRADAATQKFTKLEKDIEKIKDDRAEDAAKQELWKQDLLAQVSVLMAGKYMAKSPSLSQPHSDDEEKGDSPPPTTRLYPPNVKKKPVPDEPTEDSVVDLESGPKNRN